MTFDQWCKENYINRRYAAFNVLKHCWVAATQTERERCAQLASQQAKEYESNTLYPAYGLEAMASAAHHLAELINKGEMT